MEHYSLKKDYYDQLRQDYYEKGRDSFVFCYLEKNPRSETCFRIILGQKLEALKAGRLSNLEYVQYIIEKLSKTPKLYQEGRDYKLLLPLLCCGLGMSREECDLLERTGRKKDIQEKLRLLEEKLNASDAEARERLSKIPDLELERMTRRLEHVSLQVEVRNFFYEIGLPITDANKPQKEGPAKKTERKKDPSLNMLDAYCAQKNLVLSAPGQAQGRESGEDYDEFFWRIAKSGHAGIWIPIRIDTWTGVQLCIIGKKYIQDFPYVIHKKENKVYEDYCCAYGILEPNPEEPPLPDFQSSREYRETTFSYHVKQCLFHYQDAQEAYEIARRVNLAGIQEYNRLLGKAGCPKSLELYFPRQEECGETAEKNRDRKFLEIRDGVEPRETFGRCKRL